MGARRSAFRVDRSPSSCHPWRVNRRSQGTVSGVWRELLRVAVLSGMVLGAAPGRAQPAARFDAEITTTYPFDPPSTSGKTAPILDPWSSRPNRLHRPTSLVDPAPPGSPPANAIHRSPKAGRSAAKPMDRLAANSPMVRVPWAEAPMTLTAAQQDLAWRATLPSSGIATWGMNPVQHPERALADVLIGGSVVGVGVVLESGAVLTSLTAVGRGLDLQVRFADGSVEQVSVRRTHRAYDLALLEPRGRRVRVGLPLAHQGSESLGLLYRGGSVDSQAQGGSPPNTPNTTSSTKHAPATNGIIRPVTVTWFAATWGSDGVPIHAALRPPQMTELGSPLVNASGHLAALVTLGCVTDEPGPNVESRGCRVTRVALTSGTLGEFLGVEEYGPQVRFGVMGETTDTGWARGVRVTGVTPASPAATAGLRPADGGVGGDVIVAIDDTPVYEMDHLRSVLQSQRPGSKPVLTVLREGRLQQLTVDLPSSEHALPAAESPAPWVSF